MEILTVKKHIDGYLVNGATCFVPAVEGNAQYELIKQWIDDGNIPEPEFSESQLETIVANKFKDAKQKASDSIVVTVDGLVFDGNASARLNMMSAIESYQLLNITESEWKLADNSIALVNINQIKQALALSIQEFGRIVMCNTIDEL